MKMLIAVSLLVYSFGTAMSSAKAALAAGAILNARYAQIETAVSK